MTVIKFLQTRSTYRTITRPDGTTTSRTAWANESKLWPTYAYFGVAVVSTDADFARFAGEVRWIDPLNRKDR